MHLIATETFLNASRHVQLAIVLMSFFFLYQNSGDARLSKNVKNKVFSFDLVSKDPSVIACDMSNVRAFIYRDCLTIIRTVTFLLDQPLFFFLVELDHTSFESS